MNVMKWHRHLALFLITIIAFALTLSEPVFAQYSSTNYSANQIFFGVGGALNETSTNYSAKVSVGEEGVGNSSSTNYQVQVGFNTNREPSLTFIVNATNIDLGVLSAASTATATATFSVKSYLASGYIVQTASPPPTSAGHSLHNLSTAASSSAGSEQFGMNLVNNTTGCGAPVNFGADPVQIPSSSYSFGIAAPGYNTCGKFQYNQNDTIAKSNSSSGETDYTISFIYNISNSTFAGQYVFNGILVATSTF